jgi:hypothetical protein
VVFDDAVESDQVAVDVVDDLYFGFFLFEEEPGCAGEDFAVAFVGR